MTKINGCEHAEIMNLEPLNRTNPEGCAACGKTFTLGGAAIPAGGEWGDTLGHVHASEVVCDIRTGRQTANGSFSSPVEEPPNEPKKSPVREPGKPAPKPPAPDRPPVEEPPGKPPKPPVKEPPPKDPEREPPERPPMKVQSARI